MTSENKKMVGKIIDWYKVNGRNHLPWRRTKNPYKILIAELMLQKTHAVQQVLPVYIEFMKRYPDVKALANAEIDEIRTIIGSLGLQNTRSRRLKELAVHLLERFDGQIPREHNDLRSLPGVGDYAANAVSCVAFGMKKPMVDANFGRVLGRVFCGKEDYPPSKGVTWKLALELIPEDGCKEFNLGIIDLGALVCRPKSPLHSVCPVSKECKLYNQELEDQKRAL